MGSFRLRLWHLLPVSDRWLLGKYILKNRKKVGDGGSIPCFGPVCQIVMVHLSLQRHMLPNSDSHFLCWGHIGNWRLAWVCIWNPKRNGEPVRRSSEGDRQRAHEVKEEGREPCLVGIDICSRGKRGVLGERIGNIVVGPVWVAVGLLWIIVIFGQDTIQPIQCPLRDRHSSSE